MAGGPAADLLFGTGGFRFVRSEAVIGIQVGAFIFVPVSLVLLSMDARGRAPETWVGWALVGFAAGALSAGGVSGLSLARL